MIKTLKINKKKIKVVFNLKDNLKNFKRSLNTSETISVDLKTNTVNIIKVINFKLNFKV